jgi:hypothetical protein
LPKFRHPASPRAAYFFNDLNLACGLHPLAPVAAMAAMRRSIATATDDLESREISSAEIHDFCPKRKYGGGARRGAEEAF